MKYILSFIGIGIICCAIFLCAEKNETFQSINEDYMRIHITANSNSVKDQNLKYEVKDDVVEFLIPLLAFAENKDDAMQIIYQNLNEIRNVVVETLRKANVCYSASVSIERENIPTRSYDSLLLESGLYDCLKIDLGEAKGDNWWCVVFPAVCFISSKNSENYVYISKIWNIINNII